jgi:hypothetical protein
MTTKKSSLIDATMTHNTTTHNGALTHGTSLNNCVDFFFIAGATRNMSEKDIITAFEKARGEDITTAYKILFWARDARGGAGEKRLFQTIAKHVIKTYPEEWKQVYKLVPEYGYWKDIYRLENPNTRTLSWIAEELKNGNGLAAKFFPRKKTKTNPKPWFRNMCSHMNVSAKELRELLVKLTNVVETQMCRNQWSDIEYEKVPSVAMNMYRKAFDRHDGSRFEKFNEAVLDGETKVNASVLFPHTLYRALQNGENEKSIEAQWKSLPNYMEGSTERILPVCDVSGSMEHGVSNAIPMDVSVSLGLYISERNEGLFKDAFLTFSSSPEMVYVKGKGLASRFRQISTASWQMSTNLLATFDLVLDSAIKNNVPQEEMPTKLLIISDMEFDVATRGNTNLESIRQKYENSGYVMPNIIFWNVNGRLGNLPATIHDANIGLVSGFSPAILTSILGGEDFSPLSVMNKTVNSDRYAEVSVSYHG